MKPGPGAPGSEATAPGGAGPGKVLFLYMAISLLFNRYCIVSFKFPPRRPSPQAPNRFLVQSLARFGLQNGFWCNPRRVLRYPCRGATAYTPQTSRQGRVPDIFIRPYGGGSWGRMQFAPTHGYPAKFAGVRRRPRQTSQPRQRPPEPAGPPPRTTHTPKAARASGPSM